MPLDLNIEGGSGSDDSAWLRNRDSLANSLVLGGHREKLVATVASSREAALSEEDLRKLTVREREIGDIANYRKQMEKMSKGKPWRLDIVETVRGREFRGIIEAEDDEGGEGDGAESNKEEGRESEVKGAEEMTDRERKKEKANGGESQDSDDEGSEEVYKEEL